MTTTTNCEHVLAADRMASTPRVPVLLYHSVSTSPAEVIAPFTVSPATFRRHLRMIVDSGREAITVSELVRRRSAGRESRNAVVITFDDGFADFADEAFPLLAEEGLRATLYLTTGALRGGDRIRAWEPFVHADFLAWGQLRDLDHAGVELGAHSRTHRQLDLLPAAKVRAEIVGSKADLEEALGHPVASFAYPHGFSDAHVRDMTRAAGFTSACAVRNALSPLGDDPFRLARLMVTTRTTDEYLGAWLRGEGAPVARSRVRWRTVLGRELRRVQARQQVVSLAEEGNNA